MKRASGLIELSNRRCWGAGFWSGSVKDPISLRCVDWIGGQRNTASYHFPCLPDVCENRLVPCMRNLVDFWVTHPSVPRYSSIRNPSCRTSMATVKSIIQSCAPCLITTLSGLRRRWVRVRRESSMLRPLSMGLGKVERKL